MKKIFKFIINIPKFIILAIIYFFKFCISPFIPHVCKFKPTCSVYASEAFDEWGFFIGLKLTIKRLLHCNHKAKGGTDNVPININKKYKFFM